MDRIGRMVFTGMQRDRKDRKSLASRGSLRALRLCVNPSLIFR
jgi:hypothetical protein